VYRESDIAVKGVFNMIIDEHIHLGGLFQDTDYFFQCLDNANIDMVLAVPYMFEDKDIPRVLKMKRIPPWIAGTKLASKLITTVMKNKRFSRRYIKKLPNDYVARMTKMYPDRIYGVYWTNPNCESVSEIEKYLKDDHYVGIKLHQVLYPCDLKGKNQAIFDLAADYCVPVFIHLSDMDEMKTIMRYADKKPDLNVIVAHMSYYEEMAEELSNFSNIYMDISPLYSNKDKKLMDAVRRLGAERLVFGTDSPCPGSHKYCVERIRNLKIPEEDKQKIFSKNILHMIHRKVCIKKLPSAN